MRVALVALAVLLCGCGQLRMVMGPADESWDAEVAGLPVHYRLVDVSDPQWLGTGIWFAGRCTITIVTSVDEGVQVLVAAHELGHCLDAAYLGGSHNDFGGYGCRWGSYFCPPGEGYAEAYSRSYLYHCQLARSPLGLQPGDGIECELPDPRSVVPGAVGLAGLP